MNDYNNYTCNFLVLPICKPLYLSYEIIERMNFDENKSYNIPFSNN